jgi:RNA polymerase sigma-70 factor (ECF subfamily)
MSTFAAQGIHRSQFGIRVAALSSPEQEQWREGSGGDRWLAVQPGQGEDLIRHLYEEHGRSLLAYATRLAGDRATAEDVVQETLVRAWKHTTYLENGTGPVRGRLLTVARNIVTNRIRARLSRPQEVEEFAESPAVQRDHAQTVVESMTVPRAVDGLSTEHREVLVEIYYRGRTVAEAAEFLGVAPGIVKSRPYYALRALRATMSSKGTEVAR